MAEVPHRRRRPVAPQDTSHSPGTRRAGRAALKLALRTYYRTEVELTHGPSGKHKRFAIQPRFSTDSLYALRSAAIQGVGVAIGSRWLMTEALARNELVQLAPAWQAAPLPVSLVYPYARFYPARLRHFIELIRAEAGAIFGEQHSA